MGQIGHLVAETEKHISPKSSPHPAAIQTKIPRPGATRGACETFWKTKQNMQDRSMDHDDAPLCETINVTPDTVKANPAGPNTAGKTHSSCITI